MQVFTASIESSDGKPTVKTAPEISKAALDGTDSIARYATKSLSARSSSRLPPVSALHCCCSQVLIY